MFQKGGGIAGQIGLGQLGRSRGIAEGYVVGGLATVLALPILATVRLQVGPADELGGCDPDQGARAHDSKTDVSN